jgi:hypothetical protein
MKYSFVFALFFTLCSGIVLASCQTQSSSPPEVRQTTPVSTLSGIFVLNDATGAKGVLTTSTGDVLIESLIVDLSAYDGQSVTFTGKFSGDTLFVSAVE